MIGTGVIASNPGGPAPYLWSSTRDTLWGQNKVFDVFDGTVNTNDPFVVNILGRDIVTFSTRFDDPNGGGPTSNRGLTHEAQGANNDSGSGVFFNDGGTWKLTGLIHAITAPVANQANFGDKTFISDLPLYAD